MSTHTDGAPPSVAPEPESGSGSAKTAESGPEPDTGSGAAWLQAEIQRRMAAARNGSGGRHARHGGPDPTPAQTEYQARHASDRATAGGRRAAGLPSPVQPTRGDDGAEVPTAWTSARGRPAPPRPRSGIEGEAAQSPLAGMRPRADPAASLAARPDGDPAAEPPLVEPAGDRDANAVAHAEALQPRPSSADGSVAPHVSAEGALGLAERSGAPDVSSRGAVVSPEGPDRVRSAAPLPSSDVPAALRPPLKAVPPAPPDVPAHSAQSDDATMGDTAAADSDAAGARPAANDPAITAERAAAALAAVAPAEATVDRGEVEAPEADPDGVVVPFPAAAPSRPGVAAEVLSADPAPAAGTVAATEAPSADPLPAAEAVAATRPPSGGPVPAPGAVAAEALSGDLVPAPGAVAATGPPSGDPVPAPGASAAEPLSGDPVPAPGAVSPTRPPLGGPVGAPGAGAAEALSGDPVPAAGTVVSTVDDLVDTTAGAAAAGPGVPRGDRAAERVDGPPASGDELSAGRTVPPASDHELPAERPVPSTWSEVGPPRTEEAAAPAPSPAPSRPAGDAIGGLGGPSLPNLRAVRRPRAVPLSDTWARRVARQPLPPLPQDAPASATGPPDALVAGQPPTPLPGGEAAPEEPLRQPPRLVADAGLRGQAHLLDGDVAAGGAPLWQPPRSSSGPATAPGGDPGRQPPGLDGPSIAARLAQQVPDLASMLDTGPGQAVPSSATASDTRQAPPADRTPPAWPGQPSDGVEVWPARPGQPVPSPLRGGSAPSDARLRPAPPSGPAAARLLSDPPSLPPTVAIPTVPGMPAATPSGSRPAPVDPDDYDDLDDDYAEDPDEGDGVIWRAESPAPPIPAELPPAPVYPPGKRVRVVLAERKAAARPVRTVVDIQEDGAVGAVLRSGLIASQLRVALGFALISGLPLFLLPAVFDLFPEIGSIAIFGLRLPWLLLGVLVYPFLFGLGWWFTHVAERVEQDFADHVQD